MMAMAMSTGTVLLRPPVIIARIVMLLELGGYRRLVRTFGRFRHRCPKETESSAQRDELQHKAAGEEPGHRPSASSRSFAAKEQS